jgi:hypothetical protein
VSFRRSGCISARKQRLGLSALAPRGGLTYDASSIDRCRPTRQDGLGALEGRGLTGRGKHRPRKGWSLLLSLLQLRVTSPT